MRCSFLHKIVIISFSLCSLSWSKEARCTGKGHAVKVAVMDGVW